MKASNFSVVQKTFIVRQREEGTLVAEIFRKAEFVGRRSKALYNARIGMPSKR
ncbi:hypothetical protein GCM10008927_21680 [Amylibacter ulvae]|uniref:Uncharacterized protein n=1 Tax=Paramylibacter ulvae TaxID=1651968 RepID=A0ABQ3D2L8_9RHOB|nr:hypothetical protein GCM10008927_21680 [Amylibacter ulvae]